MAQELHNLYNEGETGPTSIHELRPKMKLRGTITKTELFGAFVDVGVGVDGLVHISQLSTERVNRVDEMVSEGNEVTVWVSRVDPKTKRIGLTMIEPPAVEWDEVRAGQVYTGKVKRVERYGAFVDIGLSRDGLVHVSELTSDYIQHPSEVVKMDDEVQVKVLKVDHRRRRLELSRKALEEIELEEEELEDEELPTAMEIALREARKDAGEESRDRSRSRQKRLRHRQEQDDIVARTLGLRDKQ